MLLISGVTITIKRTRPHPLATFRSHSVPMAIGFLITSVKNIEITGGVGRVRSRSIVRSKFVA
jgi:hypothetical protein